MFYDKLSIIKSGAGAQSLSGVALQTALTFGCQGGRLAGCTYTWSPDHVYVHPW